MSNLTDTIKDNQVIMNVFRIQEYVIFSYYIIMYIGPA